MSTQELYFLGTKQILLVKLSNKNYQERFFSKIILSPRTDRMTVMGVGVVWLKNVNLQNAKCLLNPAPPTKPPACNLYVDGEFIYFKTSFKLSESAFLIKIILLIIKRLGQVGKTRREYTSISGAIKPSNPLLSIYSLDQTSGRILHNNFTQIF